MSFCVLNSNRFARPSMRLLGWLLPLLLSLVGGLLLLALTVRGSSCDQLDDCDAFKPICASYQSDHQFFYSHCDLVRENCLTGADWQRDHFSHCNVNS